jgi:cell division protein FtsQ
MPPLRRSAAAPRRKRRSRALVWLRYSGRPVAAVALPAALAAWVLTSPRFALAEVRVESTPRVAAPWVRDSLAPLAGENLPALDLAAVERRLAAHPWVAGVELHKALPGRLLVLVRERRPAAVVVRGAGRFWADETGRLIAPLAPGEAPPLPLVREEAAWLGDPPGEAPGVPGALLVLAELAAAQPSWAERLIEIGVLSPEDYRIATDALPFPLLVQAGEVGAKARSLVRVLPEILARYEELAAVDLRFARRIVLRPAAAAAETGNGKPAAVVATPAGGAANEPRNEA